MHVGKMNQSIVYNQIKPSDFSLDMSQFKRSLLPITDSSEVPMKKMRSKSNQSNQSKHQTSLFPLITSDN